MKKTTFFLFLCLVAFLQLHANNGYNLWLDYKKLPDEVIKNKYNSIQYIYNDGFAENDPVAKNALHIARTKLSVLLGKDIQIVKENKDGAIVFKKQDMKDTGEESYQLYFTKMSGQISAQGSAGLLYGVFDLLSRIHRQTDIYSLDITSKPATALRLLNHWDNLDRTVERGYAGFSIFNWHELPEVKDPRYLDYAMANASVGINGSVLTNVNAKAIVLRTDYLEKAAALADIFRPFHIKVYLTARFSAPMELGGLPTADPLHPDVISWWQNKVDEIYRLIPDFGGFLVKANSEGQPGPQDFGRNHADGANMLAKALQPYHGVVMWRAFVYHPEGNKDRFMQGYDEFVPLDGAFESNVIIQVKNGPIDFQPREPIHPIFGAMPKTPVMLELQITKEYLGQGTHLVGLGKMYEEILQTPVYVDGQRKKLARIIDGSAHQYKYTGMAGVSNIGTAFNWTGNLFAQADWFSFGKLAWNPERSSSDIHKEWVENTFAQTTSIHTTAQKMLDISHEACVQYMTPLGLHHIMAEGHHFGPGPWVDGLARADWTSVYYHRADKNAIGFDRTSKGNGALNQYPLQWRKMYEDLSTCPEEFLLWFHRVPWNHRMKSGKTLWEEMVFLYDNGVQKVGEMAEMWQNAKGQIDEERYESVRQHLDIQYKEAKWWRNACLAYFYSIHEIPFPKGSEKPPHDVSYYKSLTFPFAPGIRPSW